MKIHGTAKGGAISKKDFGVVFGSTPPVVTTWNQLENDYTFLISTGDHFALGLEMQADSTIIGTGTVTDVQFHFASNSASSGTITCCRWADVSAMTGGNAATVLSQADHTYWSRAVSGLDNGMSDETVTNSSELAEDNVVGFVVTDASGGDGASCRFEENEKFDTDPFRASAGGTSAYSSAPAFTISTTD